MQQHQPAIVVPVKIYILLRNENLLLNSIHDPGLLWLKYAWNPIIVHLPRYWNQMKLSINYELVAQQKVNLRPIYIHTYIWSKGCKGDMLMLYNFNQTTSFSFFFYYMFAIVSLKLICGVLLCLLMYVVRFHLFIYVFFTEYDLQFLHQLPSGLLQDILYERYEQPALLDKDNVDEFLKVYDDFYGRNQPVTGRKKIPPTKPYVQMLMLYDLLKREAKRLMLNKFEVWVECVSV